MSLLGILLLLTRLALADGATVLILPVPGPKSPLAVYIKVTKELETRGIGAAVMSVVHPSRLE